MGLRERERERGREGRVLCLEGLYLFSKGEILREVSGEDLNRVFICLLGMYFQGHGLH